MARQRSGLTVALTPDQCALALSERIVTLTRNQALRIAGSVGGSATSEKKASACRKNGLLGGKTKKAIALEAE